MEQNMAIANRLKSLLEEKGMNYQTLAEKSGIPVRRVYRLVYGYTSNPGIFLMLRICEALEITVDEFLQSDEFKNRAEFRL